MPVGGETRVSEGKKVLFYHNNATPHTCGIASRKIEELGFKLAPQSPYSPDLAPSDYYLFANLRRFLSGKYFSTNSEVIHATEDYFRCLPENHFSKGIESVETRWVTCAIV